MGRTDSLYWPRRTQAEDAANGGDEQHVAAADEIAGGGEAQAVEIVVSAGILFDVDVALGDVGFGLVVVVVADEIADGVVGEELLELPRRAGRRGSCCG